MRKVAELVQLLPRQTDSLGISDTDQRIWTERDEIDVLIASSWRRLSLPETCRVLDLYTIYT